MQERGTIVCRNFFDSLQYMVQISMAIKGVGDNTDSESRQCFGDGS